MSDLTDEQTAQLELIRPERVIKWLAGALVTDKLLAYAEILEDEYMLRHGFVPVEDLETSGETVLCGECGTEYTCTDHLDCPGYPGRTPTQ